VSERFIDAFSNDLRNRVLFVHICCNELCDGFSTVAKDLQSPIDLESNLLFPNLRGLDLPYGEVDIFLDSRKSKY